MTRKRNCVLSGTLSAAAVVVLLATFAGGQHEQHQNKHEKYQNKTVPGETAKKRAPEELPRVPSPDASAAEVPRGYRVEMALAKLTYPTSVEFDDAGTMYVAEGGYIYGDDVAPARILRVSTNGAPETVAENLNGPITDLLWHDKRLYISHRGKVSVLESDGVRDIVTGLPSLGDHHNNQLAVGPDGKIYFGQGTATNSGVVGLDNYKMGWLAKYPDVHDIPAKDIRLTDQPFETPNPLTLLADKGHTANGKAHAGHHGETGKKESGHEQHNQNDSEKVQGEHAEHGASSQTAKGKERAAHNHEGTKKGNSGHEGHAANAKATKAKDHEGHTAKGSEKSKSGGANAGHEHGATSGKSKGHEGHGETPKPEHEGHEMVKSFAFHSFAKTPPDDGAVLGTVKASGTILRMNPDGSDLELYAWGLRNPFGLMWGPDGELYASDNGYDERGSRPIAHAPDCLWLIKHDAWYGFPDYAGGVPVTDTQFAPETGPAPKFLMRDHPNVEKPLVTLTHHVGAAKIDFSRSDRFGFAGHVFLALSGDMNPITGEHEERSGFEVVRIDPETGDVQTFFKAKSQAVGPQGMEYVVTAGPRRPVDVRFSADGEALYVVDVGAMAIISTATGPTPRPFPQTGVIWRVTRDDTTVKSASKAKGTLK